MLPTTPQWTYTISLIILSVFLLLSFSTPFNPSSFLLLVIGFMVQLVITSLSRSEGPRFEPGWNHFYAVSHPYYLFPLSFYSYLFLSLIFFFIFSYLSFLFSPLKKQRREVSINRPASYEPAALPLRHPAYLPFSPLSLLFLVPSLLSFISLLKRFHCRESNPGRKRERLACYQLHHNGLLYYHPSIYTHAHYN